MSRKTPKYLLPFNLDGELYSAGEDLDRFTVIDNQLAQLSKIAGDGVLTGWAISDSGLPGGLGIDVSAGKGLIGSVVHRTLSVKTGTVFDNVVTNVYMKSTMLNTNVGFALEIESPFSNKAQATFVDVTPPAAPSAFAAAAPSYNFVNLTWASNTETDFDHYVLSRSTNNILFTPLATIAATDTSYQDTDVVGSTTYYYHLAAVDTSGNASSDAAASVATMVDSHVPAEITNLRLFPGNGTISVVFDGSASQDVTDYLMTVDRLNPNGTIDVNIQNQASIGTGETAYISGLQNNARHRVRIQAQNSVGNLNTGVVAETVPAFLSAPLDVSSLAATPIPFGVSLSWTASASPTGSAVGQKASYVITVYKGSVGSTPINVGLQVAKTLTSYNAAADIGIGETVLFVDDQPYLFRIATVDSFGNESAGMFVKSTTQDTTPPAAPRALAADPLDQSAAVTWRHSSSTDVVGYNLAINTGMGFGPDTILPYVEGYLLTGLTNDVACTVRLRARDDAGNLSSPTNTVVIPELDTEPPEVPIYLQVNPQDGFVNISWKPSSADDLDHYVVRRQEVANSLSAPANQPLAVISETTFNVGTATSMVDIGLTNGSVYAYAVQAVDARGNESLFSSTILVSPSAGINVTDDNVDRVEAPTSLTATFSVNQIQLAWSHPGNAGVTNFNVYRSESEFSNFALIGSVEVGTLSFNDQFLTNGETYYYMVTAVRDNATLLLDSGGVQPANTILLGTVKASGGNITEISNSQRIVDRLQGTISEETLDRLLTHRHLTKPLNGAPVVALRSIPMIDASKLKLTSDMPLSPEAALYYQGIITDKTTGEAIKYDAGTTYAINPAAVVYNVPFVGDFQLLVAGARPTKEFRIDENNNTIVFSSPVTTGEVTINGLGLTFYVPARIDLGNRGFDISVSTGEGTPFVDEGLQTLRFMTPVKDEAVVTVTIEPSVPDFGSQQGARQVSLSPNIVLSDFVSENTTTYTSTSGAFTSSDSVFVLVDGERTTLDHYVDFDSKSIVFSQPLLGSSVALEIRGREEVDFELPASKIAGLDGSVFSTGKFLKPQLPPLSHEGRVHEGAEPVFSTLSTDNKYSYTGPDGVAGSAKTPYSMIQLKDGALMLGTSGGVLKTAFVPSLIVGTGDSVSLDPRVTPRSSIVFSENSEIQSAAATAAKSSGRLSGNVVLKDVDQSLFSLSPQTYTISAPSMATLNDGTILIAGGDASTGGSYAPSKKAFVYDPVLETTTRVADMSVPRIYHGCTRLPSGNVLLTGGMDMSSPVCLDVPVNLNLYPDGLAYLRSLKSCEVYNFVTQTMAAAADMAQARYNHSANVLDMSDPTSDLVVAGGSYYTSTGNFKFVRAPEGVISGSDRYCNQDTFVLHQTSSSERYHPGMDSWNFTLGSMKNAMESVSSQVSDGNVVFTGKKARELFTSSEDAWTASSDAPVEDVSLFSGLKDIDGPIKAFFRDSTDTIIAVTQNKVFSSKDEGLNFVKNKGLDSVGAVHSVSESAAGTLFAATDLGVYTIEPASRDSVTWFQGGLIGAGTTETFDLQPVGTDMLAATEIGVFSTSDEGQTWSQLLAADDVLNIEIIGTDVLFANAGKKLYKSADSGLSWSLVGSYDFIDESAKMVARSPLDVSFGTSTGLYSSTDGVNFARVNFDLNRDPKKNNVHMLTLLGSDLAVGYDNIIYSVGPTMQVYVLSEFSGTVPTVKVNDVEARNGFRYDTKTGVIVFERKRLANDVVKATSNYSLYTLRGGGWYSQNPNGPVSVFVNRVEKTHGSFIFDARLGQFSFLEPLQKTDAVTVSIAGTTLRNEGELFHRELEDRMAKEKGLPLCLGHEYEASVLQMGLGVEHNLPEWGLLRDHYYCPGGVMIDRSMNTFLHNAEFYVLGRRDFDRANSTIDYKTESEQPEIGTAALVPLDVLEVSPSELWVSTDVGIFVLNPLASFEVVETITLGSDTNAVRSFATLLGDVYAATRDGVFNLHTDEFNVLTVTRNPGDGLPDTTFAISAVGNNLVVGTEDTIYYAEPGDSNAYDVWFRASYSSIDGTEELFLGGDCRCVYFDSGTAYAAVGETLLSSMDGKTWRKVFSFPEGTRVTCMTAFAERLFVGTSVGVYNDDGTARSNQPNFRIEMLEATTSESQVHVNDMFATEDALYAVSDSPTVYKLQSEAWTKDSVAGASAIHQFVVTVGGQFVAIENNTVYVA